jgi:LPS export ABC transporter protein LptC
MKGFEAARYARWSGAVAIAIVVLVAGVYLHRRFAEKVVPRELPPPIPANVQQQSAQFSYAKVLGNHTLFAVRALRATEYKDQNRSMLEEVLITIYGRKGDRNDTIGAHECSYVPTTGLIRCQGTVQIDLRSAGATNKTVREGMHLETRDISFDYASEEVSTPNDVSLQFPGGTGQAIGAKYDTKNEVVSLESNVQLQFERSGRRLATPTSVKARSLEYRRNANLMQLFGPVIARQGGRTVETGVLEVDLDPQMHPRRAIAGNGVRIADAAAPSEVSLAAVRMEAILGERGAIQRIVADGNIHSEQKTPSGEQGFSAQHAEMKMSASDGRSEPRELLATGNVQADFQQNGVTRHLETAKLRLEFEPAEGKRAARVASAETLAPGEIVTSHPGESDQMRAGKFSAEFNSQNRITELKGAANVNATRQIGTGPMQETSAQELNASFSGTSDWNAIRESGSVKFRQGNRTAQADRAQTTRVTNEIVLDGNANVADATSSTSAAHIEMNQTTGEIHASGLVVSSYFNGGATRSSASIAETAHVSGDQLDASNVSGHPVYSGHARLWQGDTVVDAGTVELWRDQNRLEAREGVRGVFQEVSRKTGKNSAPVLWSVRAPKMDYWSDAGRVELTGGVQALSVNGSIFSNSLELILSADAKKQRRLDRAVGTGNVRIEQNGRIGTAERGEYIAGEEKFLLSGGLPTVSDASGNITTGRELTLFLANDTILVDSKKDSRTITKHRVEK